MRYFKAPTFKTLEARTSKVNLDHPSEMTSGSRSSTSTIFPLGYFKEKTFETPEARMSEVNLWKQIIHFDDFSSRIFQGLSIGKDTWKQIIHFGDFSSGRFQITNIRNS
jgi:hypothetical protein